MHSLPAPAAARYDMLEVLLEQPAQAHPASLLWTLQELLEPRFIVEPLEQHVDRHTPARRRQVVRIASVMGEAFGSAADFDAELRELAGNGYAWACIGAIRAGQAATVRG